MFVYRGKNSVVYDTNAIINKYGVDPTYFTDYKALVGDSSDNIRDIKGIGPKTAKKLIDSFGHIENIIINKDLIKNNSIRSSINDNIKNLHSNVNLIKLLGTTEIPYKIETLHIGNYDNYKTMTILKDVDLI